MFVYEGECHCELEGACWFHSRASHGRRVLLESYLSREPRKGPRPSLEMGPSLPGAAMARSSSNSTTTGTRRTVGHESDDCTRQSPSPLALMTPAELGRQQGPIYTFSELRLALSRVALLNENQHHHGRRDTTNRDCLDPTYLPIWDNFNFATYDHKLRSTRPSWLRLSIVWFTSR